MPAPANYACRTGRGLGREPQARLEEPLAHHADLVLDLAFLPSRRRRAGRRLDQVVTAHLQEPAIERPGGCGVGGGGPTGDVGSVARGGAGRGMQIITGVERWCHWRTEDKLRIIA